MFIGELTDKRAGTKISYTYAVKGIDAYFPEIFTEKENKASYGSDGELFSGKIQRKMRAIWHCVWNGSITSLKKREGNRRRKSGWHRL